MTSKLPVYIRRLTKYAPTSSLSQVYKMSSEMNKIPSNEWLTFYKLSEADTEMRYMNDGVPRSFDAFESKYGEFADTIWRDAIHT